MTDARADRWRRARDRDVARELWLDDRRRIGPISRKQASWLEWQARKAKADFLVRETLRRQALRREKDGQ